MWPPQLDMPSEMAQQITPDMRNKSRNMTAQAALCTDLSKARASLCRSESIEGLPALPSEASALEEHLCKASHPPAAHDGSLGPETGLTPLSAMEIRNHMEDCFGVKPVKEPGPLADDATAYIMRGRIVWGRVICYAALRSSTESGAVAVMQEGGAVVNLHVREFACAKHRSIKVRRLRDCTAKCKGFAPVR